MIRSSRGWTGVGAPGVSTTGGSFGSGSGRTSGGTRSGVEQGFESGVGWIPPPMLVVSTPHFGQVAEHTLTRR